MIITYDPTTGDVRGTMTYADEEAYKLVLDKVGETYLQMDIKELPGQLSRYRITGGQLVALKDMVIEAPPSPIYVGQEVELTGIPNGAIVIINGETQGVMDADGRLELTPQNAGFYSIVFSHPDFVIKEVRLEAVA